MSFTITKRFCDVVSRWLEVRWEKVVENGRKFPDRDIILAEISYNGLVRVFIYSAINGHSLHCDNDGDVQDGDECNCEYGILFTVYVQLWGDRDVDNITLYVYSIIINDESEALVKVSEFIRSLEGKIVQRCSLCSKNASYKDGLCDECYIHQYERTEDEGGECCICRENGGRWVKLIACGHIIHLHCCKKIEANADKKKCCPLCRVPWCDVNVGGVVLLPRLKKDPYDV